MWTNFRPTLAWFLMLLPIAANAEVPVEELPPPKSHSVLAKESPPLAEPVEDAAAEPVDDTAAETSTSDSIAAPVAAWGLIGPGARHYFVGRLGIVDYWREGRRQIAVLEEEEKAPLRPDPNYLYYREQATSYRWAIARLSRADGVFSVYFQAADAAGSWTHIHYARPTWSDHPAAESPTPMLWEVPTCGD